MQIMAVVLITLGMATKKLNVYFSLLLTAMLFHNYGTLFHVDKHYYSNSQLQKKVIDWQW